MDGRLGQRLDVDRITQMFSGTNAVRLLARAVGLPHGQRRPPRRAENAGVELGFGPLPGSPRGSAGAVWTGGWHERRLRAQAQGGGLGVPALAGGQQ